MCHIKTPESRFKLCWEKNYHLKISIIERERQKEVRNSYRAAVGSKLGVVSEVVWVGSLAWRHGLRIQYCHSCSSDSTPDRKLSCAMGTTEKEKRKRKEVHVYLWGKLKW